MIVVISWYADGSGKPEVSFHDLGLTGPNYSSSRLALLLETVMAARNKECRVYDVGETVVTLYDSTE